MFSFEGFEISLGSTFDGEGVNDFFVVERRVIELDVGCGRNFVKFVYIEQEGSNLSGGSLAT